MDSTIIIIVIGIFALIGVFLILAFRPHQKVNVRQPTADDDGPLADILVHDDMTGAHGRAEENDFIPGAERASRSFNIPDTPPVREVFTGLPESAPRPAQGKRSSAPGAAGLDQSAGEPQRVPFTPPTGADAEIEDILTGGGPPPLDSRRPRPGAAGLDRSVGEPQRVPFTPPADAEIEDILTDGEPPAPAPQRKKRPEKS